MVDFNVSTICQNLYSLMKSYYYSCTYVWMSSHCFLRFFIVMKQLNRLYHFTYMILRWKKKWRAIIINVHKIMFEWTSYLQHELFFEIFLLWWNKRDCITLRIVDIIFRWKKKWIFLSFRIFCRFVYFVILFRYIITLWIVEKSYFSSFKVIW